MQVTDLLPEMRQHVKSAPDVTLLYALRRSIRTFCQETNLYQSSLYLPLANAKDSYDLEFDSQNVEVLSIDAVQFNQSALSPTRPEEIYSQIGGYPFLYTYEPPNTLLIRPTPMIVKSTDVCLVRLTLQPTENFIEVPDVIYRRYKNAIISGAIAYCLMIPEEVWTNGQLAQMKDKEFWYGVSDAKRRRMFGFTEKNQMIQRRSFLMS